PHRAKKLRSIPFQWIIVQETRCKRVRASGCYIDRQAGVPMMAKQSPNPTGPAPLGLDTAVSKLAAQGKHSGPPALELTGITNHIGPEATKFLALDGINFKVEPDKFVSILGPSGCSKSTLLYIIGGFIPPSEGSIRVAGTPVT